LHASKIIHAGQLEKISSISCCVGVSKLNFIRHLLSLQSQ
jgi:hypothetical protein